MKKRRTFIVVAVAVLLVTGAAGAVFWLTMHNDGDLPAPEAVERFRLSDMVDGQGELKEITAQEYNTMVAERKNFVVVLHMVVCPAEFPITNSAKQLAHDESLRLYSMVEDEFAQTDLARRIKYLPSVAIIREGDVVDFLDAEADEDLPYYKTAAGLKEWLEQWVEIK